MCFVSYANWSATPIVATDLSNYRNGFIWRKNLLVNGTFIISIIFAKKEKKLHYVSFWKEFYYRLTLEDICKRRKKRRKRNFLWIELKIVRKKKYAIVYSSINREREKKKKILISFRTRIVPMARNRALIDWIVRSASLMRSFLLRSTS